MCDSWNPVAGVQVRHRATGTYVSSQNAIKTLEAIPLFMETYGIDNWPRPVGCRLQIFSTMSVSFCSHASVKVTAHIYAGVTWIGTGYCRGMDGETTLQLAESMTARDATQSAALN